MSNLDLDEIKSRINPAYAHTLGTESYERRILVEEIERLQRICNQHGQGGLRTEIARLREIESAALNLINVKGRFHTEQAYNALAKVLNRGSR